MLLETQKLSLMESDGGAGSQVILVRIITRELGQIIRPYVSKLKKIS